MQKVYTNRLLIERIGNNKKDVSFFKKLASDTLVQKYFEEYRKNKNNLGGYMKKEVLESQGPCILHLVIRLKDAGTPIGMISLYYAGGGMWLSEYALLEQYRNCGYMTETLRYIILNDLDFLMTFQSNATAIDCLIFEVHRENKRSCILLEQIATQTDKELEKSDNSFVDAIESKKEEIWYKININ